MQTESWEKRFLVVILVVVILILGACGGDDASGPSETYDGKALLESRCVQCHNLERTTGKQKTHEQWEETVTRMIEKGTPLNVDEKTVLVDYLAETYGP